MTGWARVGRIGTTLVCALAFGGCATAGGFGTARAEHERLSTLEATLDSLGSEEPSRFMDPRTRIVTYPYSVNDSLIHRRDTLEGGDAAEWMSEWRARAATGAFVAFPTVDVLRCDHGVVQLGVFELPSVGRSEGGEREAYQAHWVAAEDGSWKLDRLWLSPDTRARGSWRDQSCRSRRSVEMGLHRIEFSVEAAWRGAPASEPLVSSMREFGWAEGIVPSRGTFPQAMRERVTYSAGATVRVTPRFGLQAVFLGDRTLTVQGMGYDVQPLLTMEDRALAFMGVVQNDLIRVAAGPAMMSIDYSWDPGRHMIYDLETSGETIWGGLLQASLVVPLSRRFRPTAVARYVLMPDGEVPTFAGYGPMSVPFGGFSVGVGWTTLF